MKLCGRCGEKKSFNFFNKDKYTKTGYRSQCKECMKKERLKLKDYYKEWREKPENKKWYSEYRKKRYEKDKIKIYARNKARSLPRKPCEVCGTSESVHAHHDDYLKPLNVRWLCAVHHKQWHDQNGEGLNGKNEVLGRDND